MSKRERQIKTYSVEITATVEVSATYQIEAYLERDAVERAENVMEMNLDCSDSTAEDFQFSIENFMSGYAGEEE